MKTQTAVFIVMTALIGAILIVAMFSVEAPVGLESAKEEAKQESAAPQEPAAEPEESAPTQAPEAAQEGTPAQEQNAAPASEPSSPAASAPAPSAPSAPAAASSSHEEPAEKVVPTVETDESWFDPSAPRASLRARLREAKNSTSGKEAFEKAQSVSRMIRANEWNSFGDDGEGKNAKEYAAILKEAEKIAAEYSKDYDGFKYQDNTQHLGF